MNFRYTLISLYCLFACCVLRGGVFAKADTRETPGEESLYSQIAAPHSLPKDCPKLLEAGETFLKKFPDSSLRGEVILITSKCESDADVLRQTLTMLSQTHRGSSLGERATLPLFELLFLSKSFEELVEEAEKFAIMYPDSTFMDRILYLQGAALFELQRFDEANQKLLLLILRYPRSQYVGKAQFGIAEAYFHRKLFADAIEQYRLCTRKIPDEYTGMVVLWRLAECYRHIGDNTRAVKFLRELRDRYPRSKYGKKAQQLIAQGKTSSELPQATVTPSFLSGVEQTPTAAPIPTAKAAQPTKKGRGYTLQVGAFAHLNNAVDMVEALNIKGFDAFYLDVERNNRHIYKVRVGNCISKEESRRLNAKLLKEENLYSFITHCTQKQKVGPGQ